MAASARIVYNPTSLAGKKVADALHDLQEASDKLTLAVRIANQITNNGGDMENVVGSVEFGVSGPVGVGATFVNDIGSLNLGLTNLLGSVILPNLYQG